MKNYKIQTLSPLAHTPMLLTSDFPLKGGEPVRCECLKGIHTLPGIIVC